MRTKTIPGWLNLTACHVTEIRTANNAIILHPRFTLLEMVSARDILVAGNGAASGLSNIAFPI